MDFLRIYQHLLPSGQAWRTTVQKTLRKFFEGLSQAPADVQGYVDDVFDDFWPATTRELATWEAQFGLEPNPDDVVRRQNLAAAWAAGGGQGLDYIQGVLQTAGFPVYLHEWWVPPNVAPRTARDPRSYTTTPLIGSTQCTASGPLQPQCGNGSVSVETPPGTFQFQCDRFLQNDPHYLVNLNLTAEAPPPIPSDSAKWPFFIYVGDATFPDTVTIPEERRAEFERLILKLRPLQNWIVTLIVYECGLSLGLAYDAARENPSLLLVTDPNHPNCELSQGIRYATARGLLLP